MNEKPARIHELDPLSLESESVLSIGQSMTRMKLMTGRRLIGRLAIQSVAPDL